MDDEIAIARVEHEGAARLEPGAEAVEEQAVLVVGEEADAGKKVESQVELAREFHVAHVLLDEPEGQPRGGGALRRPAELGLREIHTGDLEAAPREGQRVASEAAGRVENVPGLGRLHVAEDPADLGFGVRLGLEAPRYGRPRFLEEPAVEHGSHYSV